MSGVGVSGVLTGTTTTFKQPELEQNDVDTVEETVESPRSFPSSLPSSSSKENFSYRNVVSLIVSRAREGGECVW